MAFPPEVQTVDAATAAYVATYRSVKMDGERRCNHQQPSTIRQVVSTEFQLLYTNGYGAGCALDVRVKSDILTSGVPTNFFRGVSTNSVEDRGQRERGSGGGSPIVRGSTQFANE
jgi:hypothetical protein